MTRPMSLRALIADIAVPLGEGVDVEQEVEKVTIDSRKVGPRTLFVACRGATPRSADGHDFLAEAVARGACALVVQDELRATSVGEVPVFVAADSRIAAASLAERLQGAPSEALQLIGVTGTNGKSTVTFLLADLLRAIEVPCAVFGTLGVGGREDLRPIGYTTPEAEVTSELLAGLVLDGLQAVAMEVSSHALATERVAGLRFRVAAFTNLSQDHLDFHGDMDSYFEAKTRLFRERLVPGGRTVLPDDDSPWSRRLRQLFPEAILWGASEAAHVRVQGRALHARGMTLHLSLFDHQVEVELPLLGQPNVDNVLCAAACALALGHSPQQVAQGLPALRPVPGRFQPVAVESRQPKPAVVVDYAHTPDALERLLVAARSLAPGRVIVVFGCGGDRDRKKRPMMGAVATACADAVILTNDNPRSEPPLEILREIESGITSPWRLADPFAADPHTYQRIPDRALAIEAAIRAAHAEDIVVIAGKGHERTQTIGASVVDFDDVVIARHMLEEPA